ncbi:ABC transporter substrate-binding protein [Berryella wangjianweii]|uniref:ABC transporter substrate-binding protein n=1 Tax=Berryella wangjianweii TaxID=2734634 RepID=A0A6M8J7X6_9ACTN|nr:ABC transporter substrate-binding protein [Berryella wangjianweii]
MGHANAGKVRGSSGRRAWACPARAARVLASVILACALTGASLLSSCSPSPSGQERSSDAASQTVTLTDCAGRTVEVPRPCKSIVAIGGTSLRLVSYLQAVDRVVGVEEAEHKDVVSCPYRHVNVKRFAQLPTVGEGGSKGVFPNEEALALLRPDVVIANVDRDTADTLQQRIGVPVVCIAVDEGVFTEGFSENVRTVGRAIDSEERAAEVVGYVNSIKEDLAKRIAGLPEPRPTAYVAGVNFRGGHGFDGTEAGFSPFDACGVTNIADEGALKPGPYTIDLEKVAAAQPSTVFVESGNLGLVRDDVKENRAYFQSIDAVAKGRVHTLIAYRFYMTNAEVAMANCYEVGRVVYPDRFADVDPMAKLDEISTFLLGAPIAADLEAAGYSFRQVDLLSDED